MNTQDTATIETLETWLNNDAPLTPTESDKERIAALRRLIELARATDEMLAVAEVKLWIGDWRVSGYQNEWAAAHAKNGKYLETSKGNDPRFYGSFTEIRTAIGEVDPRRHLRMAIARRRKMIDEKRDAWNDYMAKDEGYADDWASEAQRDGFDAGFDYGHAAATRWHSIEDGLPTEEGTYLVRRKCDGKFDVSPYLIDIKYYFNPEHFKKHYTHYQKIEPPDDENEDHRTTILAERVEELEIALRKCDAAMDMQEKRETEEFHIPQPTALAIWQKARELARQALGGGTNDDGK